MVGRLVATSSKAIVRVGKKVRRESVWSSMAVASVAPGGANLTILSPFGVVAQSSELRYKDASRCALGATVPRSGAKRPVR